MTDLFDSKGVNVSNPGLHQQLHYAALHNRITGYISKNPDVSAETVVAVCLPIALHCIAQLAEGDKADYDGLVAANVAANSENVWEDHIALAYHVRPAF